MVPFFLSVSSHLLNFVYQDRFCKVICRLAGVGLLSVGRNHSCVFPLQSRRYDSRTTIFSPEGKIEIV